MTDIIIMYAGNGDYTTLYGSGFTTCILNSFHIHVADGIYWNDTQVVDGSGNVTSNMASLQSVVSGLQSNGINVLLSIGGGGQFPPSKSLEGEHSVSDVDFMSINSIYFGDPSMTSSFSASNAMWKMLTTLVSNSGANGIDLDPEPMFFTYGAFAAATVLLTEWAQSQKSQVTWVPYMAQPSWEAYASLLAADGAQPPNWVSVQAGWWSDGGDLQGWGKVIGAPIVAGFNAGDPNVIQNQLAEVVNAGYTPAGAYIWNLSDLGGVAPSAFASALQSGLKGIATSQTGTQS